MNVRFCTLRVGRSERKGHEDS